MSEMDTPGNSATGDIMAEKAASTQTEAAELKKLREKYGEEYRIWRGMSEAKVNSGWYATRRNPIKADEVPATVAADTAQELEEKLETQLTVVASLLE